MEWDLPWAEVSPPRHYDRVGGLVGGNPQAGNIQRTLGEKMDQAMAYRKSRSHGGGGLWILIVYSKSLG